jgi:hypothetical protein
VQGHVGAVKQRRGVDQRCAIIVKQQHLQESLLKTR